MEAATSIFVVNPSGILLDTCIPTCQDNDLERDFAVHRTEADYDAAEVWKWALSMLIGATMGTLAFMVDWGIDVLNNTKYKAVNGKIYGAGEGCHTRARSDCHSVVDAACCCGRLARVARHHCGRRPA